MKARNEETVEDVQANGRGDASARMRQEERVITSRGRDAIYFYLQKHRYTALVTSFVYLPIKIAFDHTFIVVYSIPKSKELQGSSVQQFYFGIDFPHIS